MGFEEATPVQSGTIRFAIEGRDVLGQAQTGTGKTAAFGIPLIEKVDLKTLDAIQGLSQLLQLVNLLFKYLEELYKIGQDKARDAISLAVVRNISRQIRALKKHPQIINEDTRAYARSY